MAADNVEDVACPQCGHPEREHQTDAATGTTRTCNHGLAPGQRLGGCQCIRTGGYYRSREVD